MNGAGGQGHFVQQTYMSSTKLDANGKPVSEKFQSKAQGAIGRDGNKMMEKQQMYDNQMTGQQKASHQKMLNGQGRKVVKEKLGGNNNAVNTYEHYQNMKESDAQQFD